MSKKVFKFFGLISLLASFAMAMFCLAACSDGRLGTYYNQEPDPNISSWIKVNSSTKCDYENLYNDGGLVMKGKYTDMTFTETEGIVTVQTKGVNGLLGSYVDGNIKFGSTTYSK